MIATEEEYIFTRERATEFAARLSRLQEHPGEGTVHRVRVNAARSQLEALTRELAMWEAGIHEPVPGSFVGPVSDMTEEQYEALSQAERAVWSQRTSIAVKRAEIANIDLQIGILLDRIADWRRHRAWLEREIADLDAPAPALGSPRQEVANSV